MRKRPRLQLRVGDFSATWAGYALPPGDVIDIEDAMLPLCGLPNRLCSLALVSLACAAAACFGRSCPGGSARQTIAAAQRAAYSKTVAAHYKLSLCGGRAFSALQCHHGHGRVHRSKEFSTAKYCGHCHQEAHAEWRQTAHANSFRAPWYIKNVNVLHQRKGH